MPRDPAKDSNDLRFPTQSPRSASSPRSSAETRNGPLASVTQDRERHPVLVEGGPCTMNERRDNSSSESGGWCFFEVITTFPATTALGSLAFMALFVLISMASASSGIGISFIEEQPLVESTSMRQQRAFNAALQMQKQGKPMFKTFDVVLAYEWKSGATISQDALLHVAAFEQRLRSLPQWQAQCIKTNASVRQFCEVGLSYANYALPEHQPPGGSVVPQALAYNGKGVEMLPLPPLRQILRRHGLSEALLPASTVHSNDSELLTFRSIFRFKRFCCYSDDATSVQEAALNSLEDEFRSFLEDDLLPVLRRPQPPDLDFDSWPLHVWFSLPLIDHDLEVDPDDFSDIDVAVVGSLFVVLLCMVIHTRNLVMSVAGLSLLALSPLFVHAIFGIFVGHKLNVVSVASLFPALGLGVNTLLLYLDAWQAAVERGNTEAEWLQFTWHFALRGTFCATLVSSTSFFALVPSSSSLREIACFMALVNLLQWSIITLIYVPLCALDERYCARYRCCRLCASDPARSPLARHKLASRWERFIRAWHRPCVVGFGAVFLVCASLVVALVRTDDALPQALPDKHNVNRGRQILQLFADPSSILNEGFQPPPGMENVCSEQTFGSTSSDCSLFWCEAGTPTQTITSQSECQCFQSTGACHVLPTNLTIVQRFIGLSPTQLNLGSTDISPWYLMVSKDVVEELPFRRLQPLIIQEWETGSMRIEPVTEASTRIAGDSANRCEWKDLCYCGSTSQCSLNSVWTSLPQLSLPATVLAAHNNNRWPSGGRVELSGASGTGVPRVRIIVGLRANLSEGYPEFGSLWSFSTFFEHSDLWAQRALHQLCDDVSKDIAILGSHCWLDEFKRWIIDRKNGRYPVPKNEFDDLVSEFLNTPDNNHFTDSLWLRDGKVAAWYAEFDPGISLNATNSEVLAYKGVWDAYVARWNVDAPDQAKSAWCMSALWSQELGQVQASSLSGHLVSVVLSCIVAVLGSAAVNYPDTYGALFAGIVVFACYFAMLFIVGVVTNSSVGLTEVVAIVVVLAYCVSNAIHILLCYSGVGEFDLLDQRDANESLTERSRNRTSCILSSSGAPAVWSCVVAIGCSAFLAVSDSPVFRSVGVTGIVGVPVTTAVVLTLLLALLELAPASPQKDWSMPVQRAPNLQEKAVAEQAMPSDSDVLGMPASVQEETVATRTPPSDEELAAEREELSAPVARDVIFGLPLQSQSVDGGAEKRRVNRAVARASGGSKEPRRNPNQWKTELL